MMSLATDLLTEAYNAELAKCAKIGYEINRLRAEVSVLEELAEVIHRNVSAMGQKIQQLGGTVPAGVPAAPTLQAGPTPNGPPPAAPPPHTHQLTEFEFHPHDRIDPWGEISRHGTHGADGPGVFPTPITKDLKYVDPETGRETEGV
jgi:hypothetical protein